MDLKGSLVDTRLKIYPTRKLKDFLEQLPQDQGIPENVLKLIERDSKDALNDTIINTPVILQFNNKDNQNLKIIREVVKIRTIETDANPNVKLSKEKNSTPVDDSCKSDRASESVEDNVDCNKEKAENNQSEVQKITSQKVFLTTSDIDWLYTYLQKRKSNGDDVPYLHTLLEGAHVEMPENKIIKRNPTLEARCVKLRAQQEAREYRKMTKTVDNVRINFPEDSISYQMKQLNRQLIAILQFILSVGAGFLFGFRGVEWMVGNLDFGFRLLLGVMCSLVIALAEIYFLAKKLNEELNIPETVQLGGPPQFADEQKYTNHIHVPKKVIDKEHQD